jgi:dTDP-4-amino-4,6-dideoxygalactose transaminase
VKPVIVSAETQERGTVEAGEHILALHGGPKVRTAPFPSWPVFDEEQIGCAAAILRSGKVNYWTGEECRFFEREYAFSVGKKYGVALANGTLALELALLLCDLNPGDEVITSARTFIASASCAVMRGLRPVLADVDCNSGNITPATIEAALTSKTKAIIVVHLGGWPADMPAIMQLARARGIKVVEDCAQSHGAAFQGRPVGSFGDFAAFSFCQDKIITTGGEGGMLLLDDERLWKQAWAYKDHGKDYDAVYAEHPPGFRWLHSSFGTNWRMTEIQAALGRLQLRRLTESVIRRRFLAAILDTEFSRIPVLRIPVQPPDVFHSFYKYYVYLRPELLRQDWDKERVIEAINAEGVPCMAGSCSEIYLEKAFPGEWRPNERLPVARDLGDTSLMFQVHPTLNENDMKQVGEAVAKVLSLASR